MTRAGLVMEEHQWHAGMQVVTAVVNVMKILLVTMVTCVGNGRGNAQMQ